LEKRAPPEFAVGGTETLTCVYRGKSSSENLNFSEQQWFLGNFWLESSCFLVGGIGLVVESVFFLKVSILFGVNLDELISLLQINKKKGC